MARLLPLVQDLVVVDSGWASRTLSRSIRRALLVLVAAWQVVMVFSLVTAHEYHAWPLMFLYVALAASSILAAEHTRPFPVSVVPMGMGALGMLSLVSSGNIESVLAFAACWQINFATCIAGLVVMSRWVVPAVILGAVLTSTLILVFLPEWGMELPIAVIFTQVSIIVAVRIGILPLLTLAEKADVEEAASERATHRAVVTHRVSAQMAEEARVLHDSAINTLGAIANGGAGTSDVRLVREQCERDVSILDTLRNTRSTSEPVVVRLHDIFRESNHFIIRHGLDDDAIDLLMERFEAGVVAGVLGATREAVTNAMKHSGAASADVTISTDGAWLSVEVRDDGIGFNGKTPHDRGVANSIMARGGATGFTANLRTLPGKGTTVTLRLDLSHSEQNSRSQPPLVANMDVDSIVTGIHHRSGFLWSLGVTVVSVLLTVAGGRNHYFALYPMIGIMAATWAVSTVWLQYLSRTWMYLALTAATICVFILSAAATSFGSDGAVHWQALAATGPFILLLALRPSRKLMILASIVCLLGVSMTAVVALLGSVNAAGIVVVAGCVGLTFSIVWSGFQRTVSALSVESAVAQRRAFQSRISADAEEAAQGTYRRWVDAGLDSAAALLRGIARAEKHPNDAETQRICSEEEAYLRQLVLVGPDLVHLGRALVPTLRHAKEMGIPYTLRLGDRDAPDERSASAAATIILHVFTVNKPNENVAVSVYPVQDGLQLTITGPLLDTATVHTLLGDIAAKTTVQAGRIHVTQVTFA